MKVAEFLKKIASTTGLIQFSDETQVSEATAVVRTRTVSLNDLEQEFDKGQERRGGSPPPELTVEFDKLFEALGVAKLSHGWSANSVSTFLKSKDLATLDKQEAKQTLLRALQENKVPLQDILTDAVNRDKALDTYEQYAFGKLQERKAVRREKIAELEKEIAHDKERIQSLKALESQDDHEYEEWHQKKIAHEEELVKVVSMITGDRKITVGSVNGLPTKATK